MTHTAPAFETGSAADSTPPLPPQSIAEVASHGAAVLAEVATVVVGMDRPLRLALATVLAGGHVLFEDVPGLGKTLAARSLATALGLDFRRLQCTPDLLPSDITGSYVFDPQSREFEFRAGPIFTGLFLADEINRTSPKTQSAMLEAMAERQVSVEGHSFPLQLPFHVIATSNPVEYEGTYPLPEAQLDRFMLRLSVGYPTAAAEGDVIQRRLDRRREETTVSAVVDPATLLAMQAGVETVEVDPDVIRYCVELVTATRTHSGIEIGASPRGTQALVLVARALAVLDGRSYVTPEDVKDVAVAALAHRLMLTPLAWASDLKPELVVSQILGTVATPSTISADSVTSAARASA